MPVSKTLTRADIVATTHGFRTELVQVPEWGGDVLVREMTAQEVGRLGKMAIETGMDETAMALGTIESLPLLVSWVVIDPTTQQSILSEKDVQQMTGSNYRILERIVEASVRLSELERKGSPGRGDGTDPNL